jgi:hypothetical protein
LDWFHANGTKVKEDYVTALNLQTKCHKHCKEIVLVSATGVLDPCFFASPKNLFDDFDPEILNIVIFTGQI